MLALHLADRHGGTGDPRQVRVWDDQVKAFDMGDLAAQWFSDFLAPQAKAPGEPEAVPAPGALRSRAAAPLSSLKWTGRRRSHATSSADGFPPAGGEHHVARRAEPPGCARKPAMRRSEIAALSPQHRACQVVDEHDEDRVDTAARDDRIGATRAAQDRSSPVRRCPIPNIDPAHGDLVSPEVERHAAKPTGSDARVKWRHHLRHEHDRAGRRSTRC